MNAQSAPMYLGSAAAIQAAHAGQPVLVSKKTLADGRAVLHVELPPAHLGTPPSSSVVAFRAHEVPRRRTAVVNPARHAPLRPPLLSPLQKTAVIIGAVIVAVLGMFWLVAQAVSAIAAAVAGAGSMLVAAGLIALVVVAIARRRGGSGGGPTTTTTNIISRTIKGGIKIG